MLTIQPALSNTAFEANKKPLRTEQIDNLLNRSKLTPAQIAMLEEQDLTSEQVERLDELKYLAQRSEIAHQRDEFTDLATRKDIPMPKTAKQICKGGALLTTGILSGMAAGWGTGKTIKGIKKLLGTKFVINAKAQMKAFKVFVKDSAKTLKTNFLNSEAYKLHQDRLAKAHESKFWAPVLKFFGKVGKGIKSIFVKTKNGIKHVINKIKGVKAEKWEKGTVNTVGVAGGAAATIEGFKKTSEIEKNKVTNGDNE